MKKAIPISRLAKAAMARRSTLYAWMMEHHDEFARVVEEAVRPNWEALAKEFGQNGLTDGDDKAPTETGTRHTWWRVRKAVAARRKAEVNREASPRQGKGRPTRRPSTSMSQPLPADDFMPMDTSEDDDPKPIIIRPVTGR